MTHAAARSALELLEMLVGFKTVSDSSNLDCIDFIADYLDGYGIASERIFNEEGTKANLLATIGPREHNGVVLSAHTDVVPTSQQNWSTDPWTLRRENGRLYGRGTTDMKGYIAAILATVPEMVRSDLKAPIHIALSYDEEVGQKGVPSLIERLGLLIPPPQAVIVGEATGLKPVVGHKGNLCFYTNVRGRRYHSSRMDLGVSAVHVAGHLVAWLDRRMAANRKAQVENGFMPSYTTLHCGKINGGVATNIIAEDCSFVTEIRSIPDEDPEDYEAEYREFIENEIVPEMRDVAPESSVSLVRRSLVPGLKPESDGAAEHLVRELGSYTGPSLCVSYGTEAGQFQQAGWSAIVCGPGDIAQAHQADEYLDVAELERCCDFFQKLLARLT